MNRILEDIELCNGNDNYNYDIFMDHNNKYGQIFVAIPYNDEGIVINEEILYYKLIKPIEEFTIEEKEKCVHYCTGKYLTHDDLLLGYCDAFMQGDHIEEIINNE